MPPVLCYVNGSFAYFTTQALKEQWGDDWNDAPYEHNAGDPYPYSEHDRLRGRTPWEIIKVAFDGNLQTPADLAHFGNSRYSVESINAGLVPWLVTDQWTTPAVAIPAGTTLDQFIDLVYQAGGQVYTEVRSK